MTRTIWPLFALCAGAAACVGGGEHERLAARVNGVMQPLVEAGEFSGAVVLLREGRIIYQRGFGMANRAESVVFTPDTPADGGSLAHTLTAAGIWLLAYEGRVDVDAPVRQYLREYPHPETTVRQLISHTTGSQFEYSDVGFQVAALVIERVSGLPFGHFLEQRFFRRFRLTNTIVGSGGISFSAADLGRWAAANAAGRAIAPGALQAGQQRMLIDGRLSPITGLSWYCDASGLRCYRTSGIIGFHGFAYWDRDRHEAVAFIGNSAIPPWAIVRLQRGLVDALAGRPVAAEPPHEFLDFDAENVGSLAGTWRAEDLGDLTISVADARLRLRAGSGLEFEMFQVVPEAFYVPGLDYWIAFGGRDGASVMHVRSLFVDTVARR